MPQTPNQAILAKLQADNAAKAKSETPERKKSDVDWINLDLTNISPDLQEAWQQWHIGAAAFRRLLNEKLEPDDGWTWLVTDRRGGCAIGLAKVNGNNTVSLTELIERINAKG